MHRAAGAARSSRTQAAAGDSCRRHQRQGLDASPICARCWKPRACASTSSPRPIWCGINECFRLGRVGGGVLVGDDELRARAGSVASASMPASRSPCSRSKTAAAFQLFAQNPADVVLLEVGLGGRLDFDQRGRAPLASVITPVSMDHMEFLGDTLTSIAGEKAAIIKRGVPVICAEQARRGDGRDRGAGQAHARAAVCARARAGTSMSSTGGWSIGRARPDGSRGAATVRPPPVRQCRSRDRDAARDRRFQDQPGGVRGRHRRCRMAGADAAHRLRASCSRSAPQGSRDLARRRPQCRRRPRRGGRARRSRGAGVAAAGRDRRHDGQQGCAGFSRQFRRADPPHHRGADSRHRERDAGRPPRGCRAQPRHARGDRARRRGRAALAWRSSPTKCRRAS